jgi:hypothetical protein
VSSALPLRLQRGKALPPLPRDLLCLCQGAADLFAQKRVEFQLFFSPNDSTANTEFEERQWEASFALDLSRLNWFSKDLSSGREKVDVLVPIVTKSLGSIIAKISGPPLLPPFPQSSQ